LCRVGDDALLGAAEVVVEEVLEPHAGDEEEVPAVGAAEFDVFHGAVCGDFAVAFASGAEALVELLQEVLDLEVGGCGLGLVVAEKREGDADDREPLAASGVVDAGDVLGEAVCIDERCDRCGFLGLLVDHERHGDAAVRWQPQESWPQSRSGPWTRSAQSEKVDINEMGNQSRVGSPRPVCFSRRGRVREGVALRLATFVRDLFVAAGEADRLEGEEVDLLRVVEGKLDDAANLLVVDAVDDGGDGTMSTPASWRLWMAWSFTSNALPTLRCELAALPMPSNWR